MPRMPIVTESPYYTREEIVEALQKIWSDPDYERDYALYLEMLAAFKAQRER